MARNILPDTYSGMKINIWKVTIMRSLKVTGRYLSWDDGTPFFYLADTAWQLLHALTREEIEFYFACRARQGLRRLSASRFPKTTGSASRTNTVGCLF